MGHIISKIGALSYFTISTFTTEEFRKRDEQFMATKGIKFQDYLLKFKDPV
jgi:hypothetical protein